jgi:hypothetical protein
MPRLRKADPPVEWKLRIPTSLAAAVTRHLPWDPLTNRPRLGARSDLTVRLYRAWLTSLLPDPGDLEDIRSAEESAKEEEGGLDPSEGEA